MSEPKHFIAVPGVLGVTDLANGHAIVEVGPLAGWPSPFPISSWKRTATLLRKKDATNEDIWVENVVDAAKYPHSNAVGALLPIVGQDLGVFDLTASPTLAPCRERTNNSLGTNVYQLAYDRQSGWVHLRGRGVEVFEDTADWQHCDGDELDLRWEVASTTAMTRVIRALTNGLADAAAAELAMAFSWLENIYPDGLQGFEAELSASIVAAQQWQPVAEEIVSVLENNVLEPVIPYYGQVVAVKLDDFTVKNSIGEDILVPPEVIQLVRV